jgi:uroporphyrin-III C-methyltransferase
MSGHVTLVGAGPGDPELLTLRAARALQEADVVLYDALVDARVLDLAKGARRLFVGKRRNHHAVSQETIGKLLVRFARRGERVVRLKAGDPFVFGRGGEEVLACAAAGVSVSVVPGVTSAFAGPLLANIPVTHRGVARGCVVLTGTPREAYESVLPRLVDQELTIVLLMALDSRAAISDYAIAQGFSPDHPAAIICGASTQAQATWTGTLAELPQAKLPDGPPGIIVLGNTVRFAESVREHARAATESSISDTQLQAGDIA